MRIIIEIDEDQNVTVSEEKDKTLYMPTKYNAVSPNILGTLIKKYRFEHGLSIRDFGKLCDISYQYICNLERGYGVNGNRLSPSLKIYQKIANVVGADALDLIAKEMNYGKEGKKYE